MASDDVKSFEVAFECDATGVGSMRCEMDVRLMVPEVIEWEMASDEYGFHGGDGTAPLPIAYFIAGLTSCLMTQMRIHQRGNIRNWRLNSTILRQALAASAPLLPRSTAARAMA